MQSGATRIGRAASDASLTTCPDRRLMLDRAGGALQCRKELGDVDHVVAVGALQARRREPHRDDARRDVGQVQIEAVQLVPPLCNACIDGGKMV